MSNKAREEGGTDMLSLFARSELKDLIEKVEHGERLEFEDGVRLMKSKDILALGYMANLIREKKNGDRTYFLVNRPFDSTKGDSNSFTFSLEQVNEAAHVALGKRWLEIQEIAHRIEKRTYATMLYGHIETAEEIVEHFLQLRSVQDETRGFLTFIPLPVYPKDTQLEGSMGVQSTTGFEDLRMLSISRILLDNVDHIKAYWIMLGPKLAQVSLNFGVDDLDGTVVDERSISSEGEKNEQVMSVRTLLKMIHKAGRQAIERDSLYQVLKDYGRKGGSL